MNKFTGGIPGDLQGRLDRVGVGIESYITKRVFPDSSEGRFSKSFVGLDEGEDNEPSASERHQASVSQPKESNS